MGTQTSKRLSLWTFRRHPLPSLLALKLVKPSGLLRALRRRRGHDAGLGSALSIMPAISPPPLCASQNSYAGQANTLCLFHLYDQYHTSRAVGNTRYVRFMYQMICPVLERLQAMEGGDGSDGAGTGTEIDEVRGGLRAHPSGWLEPGGGGGGSGRLGAHLPALARPLRGGRRGGSLRPPPGPPLGAARGGGRGGAGAGVVRHPLLGLHGQALPREAGGRSRLQAQLQLAAAELASPWAQARGAQAWGAPAQAAAPCAPRHDAAPGRLTP